MSADQSEMDPNQQEETNDEQSEPIKEETGKLDRRAFLKSTAAAGAALQGLLGAPGAAALAAGAGLIGAEEANAQASHSNPDYFGLMPEGGIPPYRLPMGALDYLDRKDYIHNMKIISYTPGVMITVAEPLVNMWAKGARRLLPFSGGFLDISNPSKPEVVNRNAWPRSIQNLVVFNTKLKKWILMTSASQPITSATPLYPHGQWDRALREKVMSYKGFRGIRTFDVTNPEKPNLLQEFNTGPTGYGAHMNFYDGGQYAFLDCGWTDQLRMENAQRALSTALMVVDMSDPSNVKEVSRWWAPGQMLDEDEKYKNWTFANDHTSWTGAHGAPVVPKRIEDGGKYGYGGFGAFGMYVFDFSDIRHPKAVGHGIWDLEPPSDIPYHTVYPIISDEAHPQLKNKAFSTVECLYADGREPYHTPHMIDISDPTNPQIIGNFPRPKPPKEAPYADFIFSRGRFGSHNPQAWVAPGRMRPELAIVAWFNAGVRVFDLSEPTAPKEIAYYVPPRAGKLEDYESWWRGTTETVFVEWDRKLIWIGTHAGTYCLSADVLGEPVLEPQKIERWTVPHVNLGWDG